MENLIILKAKCLDMIIQKQKTNEFLTALQKDIEKLYAEIEALEKQASNSVEAPKSMGTIGGE